jgi:hypothetical protein
VIANGSKSGRQSSYGYAKGHDVPRPPVSTNGAGPSERVPAAQV